MINDWRYDKYEAKANALRTDVDVAVIAASPLFCFVAVCATLYAGKFTWKYTLDSAKSFVNLWNEEY